MASQTPYTGMEIGTQGQIKAGHGNTVSLLAPEAPRVTSPGDACPPGRW
jgi:hypothetical protein